MRLLFVLLLLGAAATLVIADVRIQPGSAEN